MAGRGIADRGALLRRDALGDELLDPAVLAEHAERSVAGVRDVHRELDDPLQDGVERQLGGEGEPGLDQQLRAVATAIGPS